MFYNNANDTVGTDSFRVYRFPDSTAHSGESTTRTVIGSASDATTWETRFNPSAAPIPEPTSGMLMLLGLAGLALKRKRA